MSGYSAAFFFPSSYEARFVVTESGERFIENFAIRPYKNPDSGREEDFDFKGGFWSQLVNSYLERQIDPSGIGRTVSIQFINDIKRTTLTHDDFLMSADIKETWSLGIVNGAEVFYGKDDIVKRLVDAGIIRLFG